MFLQDIPHILGTGVCIRLPLCIAVVTAAESGSALRAEERHVSPFWSLPRCRAQEHVPMIAGKLLGLFESQLWNTPLVNELFQYWSCKTSASFY